MYCSYELVCCYAEAREDDVEGSEAVRAALVFWLTPPVAIFELPSKYAPS